MKDENDKMDLCDDSFHMLDIEIGAHLEWLINIESGKIKDAYKDSILALFSKTKPRALQPCMSS